MVEELQQAFDGGRTRPIEWRRQQMRQLWTLVDVSQDKRRKTWGTWHANPTVKSQNQSVIHKGPKGVVLIIAPWNYPIVLLLLPLLGAFAAGNCAILKPSEFAPRVTAALTELIPKYLDRDCFRVVRGGKEVVENLLEHPLGHIFFTGSTSIGKSIMAAASKHLTSLTLELGGKSPAIVTESANIAQAAKRIGWGKFLNAGQTCVALDYVLVQESILPQLLQELEKLMETSYAHDPNRPAQYGRIINTTHFDRLTKLLSSTHGIHVPSTAPPPHRPTLSIPPTIFGPILPVLSFPTLSSLPATIGTIDATPLATYIFSSQPTDIQYLNEHIASGTTCINDVMSHMAIPSLPFSGRGSSGMGAYRGKGSIE
ncbi:MAG: hypothetical protein LQ338_006579 [Usnochroma carphineum]|nr:MAG: hypothetical protein LQ338_006579 [Usnochroma carphineum]